MALKLGRQISSTNLVLQGSVIPPGTVAPFAGGVVPAGWLLCNGALLSRTTYSALYAVIQNAHGSGDGITTFRLPDYRGRFLRGVDGGAANDPDRTSRTAMSAGGAVGDNVGSVQGQAFQTHTHTQDSHNHTQNEHSHTLPQNVQRISGGAFSHVGGGSEGYINNPSTTGTTATNIATTATNQNASASGTHAQATANETRPVNINVTYIIKI